MEKKKILIVSSAFYPMNSPRSFRTTELVKEFARQGHDVTLLTLKDDKDHIPFEQKYGVWIKDLGKRKLPDIKIDQKVGVAKLFNRVVRRGLYQLLEYPNIELMFMVKRALKFESGYDLLISIAVPHPNHWGVAWAWRKDDPIADTWVADCGDPYMGQTLDSFRKIFYFKYLEKSFCRKADYITVPLEGAKEGYYPEFRDKIRVIPQGFDFNAFKVNGHSFKPNTVPTFAYAGGFIPGGRDPRSFLDRLVQLDRDFKFILYTQSIELILPYLEKAKGRIEIRDYVPREELMKKLVRMDFLVNVENQSSLMMPSKLIDYYLAGRPVLSVNSDEVNPKTINQFLDGNYERRLRFNGIDNYRIENVCNQFLNLCSRE